MNAASKIFKRLSYTNFTWSILEYFVAFFDLHLVIKEHLYNPFLWYKNLNWIWIRIWVKHIIESFSVLRMIFEKVEI